jgi:acyl-CoA synthetase (NDP forming)
MSGPQDARGPKAVARFLRPRSMAIVGMSSRAGSPGQVILQSLKLNRFAGDIHLVGRSSEPIDGRPVLKSADELPEGVDLAVFTLPAAGVREAIEACARRKVGSAMIFAAGFAEVGDQVTQDAVTETARAAGLAVVGPNCLGVTNNVDGMMLHMLFATEAQRGVKNGIAFVGQSGGLLGHFQRAADGLGLPLAYVISTGNEAGLESSDFLEFLADDPATRVIALYCEQIRRPAEFLAACRRARAACKPVVLMQAGRSAKSRKSAQSHTGALIGDYATIKTQAEDAGAVVVSTMDEMMDLTQILVRYPVPPAQGPGILTASGAYVGLTNDFAEDVGLELPALEPETLRKVGAVLPAYGNYGNPLDVTARRHRRLLAGVFARRGQGADRRSERGNAVHLVPHPPRLGGAWVQPGHGRLRQAQGHGGAGRHLAARPRSPAGCCRKPGGVLAFVGPHAARDRALHPLRPPACARPRRRRGGVVS